ncbi:MAG: ferredoxin family protein [Spirochaetota bacterium]|jgi:ferredoxin
MNNHTATPNGRPRAEHETRGAARRRARKSTRFIRLDARACEACWKCVEACPRAVIGKIDFFFHRHAVIANAGECTGCLKCVKVCEYGAIQGVEDVKER